MQTKRFSNFLSSPTACTWSGVENNVWHSGVCGTGGLVIFSYEFLLFFVYFWFFGSLVIFGSLFISVSLFTFCSLFIFGSFIWFFVYFWFFFLVRWFFGSLFISEKTTCSTPPEFLVLEVLKQH